MEENNIEQGAQAQNNGQRESTKKIHNQLIMLLLVLGGIILLLIAVFAIFMPVQTENETLQLTVQQKEAEYQETLAIAQKQKEYEQDITVNEANIKNILASYPSDVKYEDEIYYVKDILETNYASLKVSSIGFSPQVMLISSDQAVAAQGAQATTDATTTDATATDATATDATAAAGGMSGYQLYSSPVALSESISYDDLKQLLDFINNDISKKNYDTVNISFDQTSGNLSVSMNLNFLTIAGTENEYEPSAIPDTTGIGKSNIFNSLGGGSTAPADTANTVTATDTNAAATDNGTGATGN